MNKIFERPNGKYWTPEDVQALDDAKSYHDLFIIALRILDRMPQDILQICGPLTTGGKGSFEANVVEFDKAIFHFSKMGENVFDQMPFQDAIGRLSKKTKEYNTDLLTEFYLPLFQTKKVRMYMFLPGWESSTGATWEHKQVESLGLCIIYLPKDWDKSS